MTLLLVVALIGGFAIALGGLVLLLVCAAGVNAHRQGEEP